MAELPPEMARLIEAARRAHDPSDADSERVRRGLAAAIGAQASSLGHSGAPEGAVGSASSGTLGSLLGATGGKLLVVAALVGGAGGVWTWRTSSESPRTGTPTALVTRAPRANPAPQPSPVVQPGPVVEMLPAAGHESSAVAHAGQPVAPADVPLAEPPRTAARASTVRQARGTTGAAPPARKARGIAARAAPQEAPAEQAPALDPQTAAPAQSNDTASVALAAEQVATQRVPAAQELPRQLVKEESEVALIRAALASLNANDPQRALELLDAHAVRFPIGAMGRERAGLRVLALCAADRLQEGRREQAAFLAVATDSPLQNRVRRACE